jgi:ABC-type nitrate/sulfonate/bicarbonate transport system substrate-binding protein
MQRDKSTAHKILTTVLAAFLTLAMTACGNGNSASTSGDDSGETASDPSSNSSAETETKELFPLRVESQAIFNEISIADALGFFEDEGIEIKYIGTLPQGVTSYQLMEQGELDAFVSSHPPQTGIARVAGIKAVSVAPGSKDTEMYPHIHYLVRNESDIQTLDDLLGKKIAISGLSACTNGFIDIYFREVKPDYNPATDIEYVHLGSNTEQSLLEGLVDASSAHNPSAGVTLATGEVREIATSNDILKQEGFSLAARGFLESFIEEHPDVVQGFVNAIYRARVWNNDHLDESIALNAEVLGVDPGQVSAVVFDERKNHNAADMERWAQFGEVVGNWEPGQITADDLYTNDFVPDDAPASDKDLHWEDVKAVRGLPNH